MKNQITEHLKSLVKLTKGSTQGKYYKFLLKHGKQYVSEQKLPSDVLAGVEKKMCYKNSILASIRNSIDYSEGFYITDLISLPLDHAFNDIDGKAYDSTTTKFNMKIIERFGVVVPAEILMKWIAEDETTQYRFTPLQYYFNLLNDTKHD